MGKVRASTHRDRRRGKEKSSAATVPLAPPVPMSLLPSITLQDFIRG